MTLESFHSSKMKSKASLIHALSLLAITNFSGLLWAREGLSDSTTPSSFVDPASRPTLRERMATRLAVGRAKQGFTNIGEVIIIQKAQAPSTPTPEDLFATEPKVLPRWQLVNTRVVRVVTETPTRFDLRSNGPSRGRTNIISQVVVTNHAGLHPRHFMPEQGTKVSAANTVVVQSTPWRLRIEQTTLENPEL